MGAMKAFRLFLIAAGIVALVAAGGGMARAVEQPPPVSVPAEPLPEGFDAQAPNACGQCPAGTETFISVKPPPEFRDCTDAYQYYTALEYEFILYTMLNFRTTYTPEYAAFCQKQEPDEQNRYAAVVARNSARVQAEFEDIARVMTVVIRNDIPQFLAPHCKTNRPAQDETIAAMHEWVKAASAGYDAKLAEMLARDGKRGLWYKKPDCHHLVSGPSPDRYGMAFDNDILLGIAATYNEIYKKEYWDRKRAIRAYKYFRERLLRPAPEKTP